MGKSALPLVRFLVFAALLVLAAGCSKQDSKSASGPGSSPGKTSTPDTGVAKDPEFKITAVDLAKETLRDEKAANAKYKGKVVEVEGEVFLVGWDDGIVTLTGAKKKPNDILGLNVLCIPAASDKDKARWLGKGQKVKVVGQVTAASSFPGVSMDLCMFTELSPNQVPKVTAEQLAGEFLKDTVAAEKKYNDKEIIVEGTVADLEKRKDGFYIAKLAGQAGVTINFTVSQKTFDGLKKGDKVTMKGDLSLYEQKEKYVNVNSAYVLKKE